MASLPPNWSALTDAYGRTYYHNRLTNQTTWTLPGGPSPPGGYPGASGGLYPPTQSYQGPASGVGGNYTGAAAAGAAAGYAGAHHSQEKGLLGKIGKHLGVDPAMMQGLTGQKQHQGGYGQGHGHGHGHGHSGGHDSSLSAAHTFSRPMTFVLKEKVMSLSGDSFSIKDDSGRTQYRVDGKMISFHEKKVLTDAHGHKIYHMKEALVSLRKRQTVVDAKTGAAVATIRQKSFIPTMGKSKIQVWKGGHDDGEPWLQCKGDILRKSFRITEVRSGREICSVHRKSFNLKNLLFEKDTYVATIAPHVNAALLLFLVVAIDEVYRDSGDNHASSTYLPTSLAKIL